MKECSARHCGAAGCSGRDWGGSIEKEDGDYVGGKREEEKGEKKRDDYDYDYDYEHEIEHEIDVEHAKTGRGSCAMG